MRRVDLFRGAAILAVAAMVLPWGLAPAGAAESAPAAGVSVPKPVDFGSDQVNAAVILPNPARLIQRAEAFARTFAPDQVAPGMLLAQAGQMLGDPNLAALDAGKPIVALVLTPTDPNAPPPVALMLTVKDAKPYEALLKAQGLAAKATGGLLLGALTPDALAAAEALVPTYQKVAQDPGACDLRIYGSMERLLKAYGPMLYGLLDSAISSMGALMALAPEGEQGAGAMKLLRLEVKAMMILLGQMGELQLDLTLSPDAIRTDAIVTGKAGAAMADLLAATPSAQNPGLALLPAGGVMRGSFQMEGKRLGVFTGKILELLATDPEMQKLLTPDFKESMALLETWFGDSTAMTMRALEGKGLVGDTVMAVKDPAACMTTMEKSAALFSPGGAWYELYKQMGMPMSMALKKDVRKHGDVAVHCFKVAILKVEGMPAEQVEQMKAMMKDTEFAFAKGYYLASQDPASLDAMIDRTLKGGTTAVNPLHAAKVFGAGRHGYLDMDLVGLMKLGIAMGGPAAAQAGAMFDGLKPGEPMTMAVTIGDGRMLFQMRIPLGAYADLIKSMQAAPPPGGAAPPPGPQ